MDVEETVQLLLKLDYVQRELKHKSLDSEGV
jgi:hypothetical protein